MTSKLAPPPAIARETLVALIAATTEFAAAKPWEIMADCDVVGLTDSVTGGIRLALVLGNGGEVFGAAFYRGATGIRWLLNALNSPEDCLSLAAVEGIDAIKVELVPKRELLKGDLELLKTVNFKPSGQGRVWPQFQSSIPGFMPWFVDQTEAEQLLADIPRLTKFHALLCQHPNLFEEHLRGQIPFLPSPMPSRPLVVADLDWRPVVVAPESFEPFAVTGEQLASLKSLEPVPTSTFEFGCSVMPGSSVLEHGRPCYSRISLLVEHRRGIVLGFELSLSSAPFSQSVGLGLVNTLVKNRFLPGKILIDDQRLEPILKPLCSSAGIKLTLSKELEALAEAKASLETFM
jgi:hypothetical protein